MKYFCIACNAVHTAGEKEEIFLTGFHFVDGEKLPAGYCKNEDASLQTSQNSDSGIAPIP